MSLISRYVAENSWIIRDSSQLVYACTGNGEWSPGRPLRVVDFMVIYDNILQTRNGFMLRTTKYGNLQKNEKSRLITSRLSRNSDLSKNESFISVHTGIVHSVHFNQHNRFFG